MFDQPKKMIVHVLQIYLLELVICQLCILETREGGGGGAGLLPIYEIVQICGENSLLFKHCQVYNKPPSSKKKVYD